MIMYEKHAKRKKNKLCGVVEKTLSFVGVPETIVALSLHDHIRKLHDQSIKNLKFQLKIDKPHDKNISH